MKDKQTTTQQLIALLLHFRDVILPKEADKFRDKNPTSDNEAINEGLKLFKSQLNGFARFIISACVDPDLQPRGLSSKCNLFFDQQENEDIKITININNDKEISCSEILDNIYYFRDDILIKISDKLLEEKPDMEEVTQAYLKQYHNIIDEFSIYFIDSCDC